ncbi:hypothetical protein [Pleurochrysis sp. endemic virus unk]|nr:hypothetical protein [Pleurochrysis sp. endemic virus 1b]AUL80807.1 hypothetical protein [Pleurochrysis sp. endemic virus unk]
MQIRSHINLCRTIKLKSIAGKPNPVLGTVIKLPTDMSTLTVLIRLAKLSSLATHACLSLGPRTSLLRANHV